MIEDKPKFDVEKVRELMLEYRTSDDRQEKERIEQEVLNETVKRHYHALDDGTAFEDAGDEELFWAYWDTESGTRRDYLDQELSKRGFSVTSLYHNREWIERMVDQHGLDFFRYDSSVTDS